MELCKENITNIRTIAKQFEACINQILPHVDLLQKNSYVDYCNPTCLAIANTMSTLGVTLKSETEALQRNMLHSSPPQSPPDQSTPWIPNLSSYNSLVFGDVPMKLPSFPQDLNNVSRIMNFRQQEVPKSSRISIKELNSLPVPSVDLKKRKRAKGAEKKTNYVCRACGVKETPEWRKGPLGKKTLCNACGLRWAKALKNQAEQERVYLQYVERLNEYTQEQLHLAINQKVDRKENWEEQRREIENLTQIKQEVKEQHRGSCSPVRDRRSDINFLLN
eukprot:TRINITY_DN5905_c0_g1_i1.p1 TRINITY_DN5905_c0_g1~~TRINITY_DN5905_c0_g1_i1.p1  ORF type:complete len:277 (+),score=55.34 TRINITY_DN5905_c0_g1_i1:184-1014(+)